MRPSIADKLFRIKPLEWQSVADSVVHISITTPTNSWGGYYHIFQRTPLDKLSVRFNNGTFSDYKTLESAKFACQEHYLSRLMGSLEEVDTLERVKEFCEEQKTYIITDLNARDIAEEILDLIDNKQ